MKTRMKAFLVATSGAIAAALLASSFAPGGRAARAEVPGALSAARPEMVMISTAALDGLEQRVSYLEEVVASLALASQHIRTYQLCVSGDDGAETCLAKPQFDALLANLSHIAVAAPQAAHGGGGGSSLASPTVAVTTARDPEPAATAAAHDNSKTDPESTGSIPPAAPAKDE
jgi:hypothetical protein